MNDKPAADETMSKMADATRLRTRQLIRFSQGFSLIAFAVILLAVGFTDYLRNDHEWLTDAFIFLIPAWLFVSYMIEASIRKKSPLRADAYRGSVLQQVIVIGIFILFVICYFVFQRNRIIHIGLFPSIILGLLCLGNLQNFIDARLPEDLAGSIAFLGLALTNIFWSSWWNNYGIYFILWGLIYLLQGVILHIRWQRFARQVSDETGKEQAT